MMLKSVYASVLTCVVTVASMSVAYANGPPVPSPPSPVRLLNLDAEAAQRVHADDVRRASAHKPFYKTWWFWTSIGIIGAAAAGTGSWYAITRRDDPPHSADVTATWQPAGQVQP